MMTYLWLGVEIVGTIFVWIITMFLLWRKFRLDVGEREILVFGISCGTVWLLLRYVNDWVALLVLLNAVFYLASRNKWDVLEIWDFLAPLVIFDEFIINLIWKTSFGGFNYLLLVAGLLAILAYKYYRRIRWYRSGKTGFTGMFTLGLYGAWLVSRGFILGHRFIEEIVGVWLLTGSIISIYLRSRLKLVK